MKFHNKHVSDEGESIDTLNADLLHVVFRLAVRMSIMRINPLKLEVRRLNNLASELLYFVFGFPPNTG